MATLKSPFRKIKEIIGLVASILLVISLFCSIIINLPKAGETLSQIMATSEETKMPIIEETGSIHGIDYGIPASPWEPLPGGRSTIIILTVGCIDQILPFALVLFYSDNK